MIKFIWKKLFKKVYFKLTKIFIFFKINLKFLKKNFLSEKNEAQINLYIDINENIGRYYYLLIKFFSYTNVNIILSKKINLFFNNRKYNEYIFSIKNIQFKNYIKKPEKYIYISDQVPIDMKWKHFVKLDYDIFFKKKDFEIPYSMHPMIYHKNLFMRERLNTERNIDIFFAGGGVEPQYDNEVIGRIYNKLSRKKALNIIKNHFTNQVSIIKKRSELYCNHLNKIVIVEGNNFRIPIEEWLYTLMDANFFLALPGVLMPQSHNIIEAMSVGTIPITQYPEFFNPPLKKMYNCIVYKDSEDLIDKIYLALSLKPKDILKIRNNVSEYYSNFLNYKFVSKKIIQNIFKINTLYYNTEEISLSKISKNYV